MLIGLSLVLILVMVRLNAGPIELGWLQPRIERALTPDYSELKVRAERIELRLDREESTLDLVGVDVRFEPAKESGQRDAPLLAFPEVEMALSVEAFLQEGIIAAATVHANAPSLMVTRNEEGVIDLSLGTGGAVNFGGFMRHFLEPSETDRRLSYLKSLQISGGQVTFHDRLHASSFTSNDADLLLNRRDGGIDGWLRANILQESSRTALLQLSTTIANGADRLPFTIDVVDLMPAALPTLWPTEGSSVLAELSGVQVPLRASVSGEVGFDGALSPLVFDIEANASGVVDLPTHLASPLVISSAVLRGTLASDWRAIEIDYGSLVSRGALLSGSGDVAWREGGQKISLDLVASHVRAEDLPAFWPITFGIRTRQWTMANLSVGTFTFAKAKIDLHPEDFGSAFLRADAIDGMLAFDDMTIRYLKDMPLVEQVGGTAVFDADRMLFDVEGGTTKTGVDLTSGAVSVTGIARRRIESPNLHVQVNAEGTSEQALTFLDHPPVNVSQKLKVVPAETAGFVAASVDVRLPLQSQGGYSQTILRAEATLTDLAIQRLTALGGDVDVDKGQFTLNVEPDVLRLTGEAAIKGIPLAITVSEPRDEKEAVTRRISLGGQVDQEQLDGLGLAVDGLNGAFEFHADVTETESHYWVDLETDLTDLAVAPPGLVWQKPAGQKGDLHASIAMPRDGPLDVKHFNVITGDLKASGTLQLSSSNDAVASLNFDRFRLEDSDAAIRYVFDDTDGALITIDAKRFNVDALFGIEQNADLHFDRFHVVLGADQLRIRGMELVDTEAEIVRVPEGWDQATLLGSLPDGEKVTLEFTPEGDRRKLEIRSDDAGALLEAMDLGQRVKGGRLLLRTRLSSQDPVVAEGRFQITDFILEDAPLLARMLTLASFSGIGNVLEGEGIEVDRLNLPFTMDDHDVTIADGLMRGSQLGLTVKGGVGLENETLDLAGTIIPIYSLNRLIGKVPIIGQILTGADGHGAFAATYSLKGARRDPTVYVNPLSLLTPGLLRDLVGGLINGTLEPPDIREDKN